MTSRPRALLLNPWIHDFTAYDLWARPRGLLQLAAALRAAGWLVSLIDCLDLHYPGRTAPFPRRRENGSGRFDETEIEKPPPLKAIPRRYKRYGAPRESVRERLRATPRPDAILVGTAMTYWYGGAAEAIAEARRAHPGVPVIAGGVYATLLPEHAKERAGADFAAAGDFRESLPAILRKLGLPDGLPADDQFPAWDLYSRLDSAAILAGRGCPRRCPYCAVPALAPRVQLRPAEAVIAEIEKLVRDFQVRDLAFFDDALRAGGDERLIAILEGAARRSLPVRFHFINALSLAGLNRELALLFRRARVSTLRFGLETADPARNEALGAKADLADLELAVAGLTAAGYSAAEIGAYLLAGLPGQPASEIEASIRAVLAAGARPFLTEYSPVPKSPLWPAAVKSSRFDLAEPLYHNNTLIPCAVPELDVKELARLKMLTREPFRGAGRRL